jgi:hypothetical protein
MTEHPNANNEELWHALTEFLRGAPDEATRNAIMREGLRAMLIAEIERPTDWEAELKRAPVISEEARQTLISLLPEDAGSLWRIQRRLAFKRLDRELEKWPEERHGELITEFRDRLKRRRNALGEVQPHDAAEAQEWMTEGIQEGVNSPDRNISMDDILAHVKARIAFRELVQEILAQPDADKINAMRGAAGQMRRERRLNESLDDATAESREEEWLRDNHEDMDDANRHIDERFQRTREALDSADRGECISQAEMEIANTEALNEADHSDRPRWGQITAVYNGAADVWDGALRWPIDTNQSVADLTLGTIVWFRPEGEFAVVEQIDKPGV